MYTFTRPVSGFVDGHQWVANTKACTSECPAVKVTTGQILRVRLDTPPYIPDTTYRTALQQRSELASAAVMHRTTLLYANKQAALQSAHLEDIQDGSLLYASTVRPVGATCQRSEIYIYNITQEQEGRPATKGLWQPGDIKEREISCVYAWYPHYCWKIALVAYLVTW